MFGLFDKAEIRIDVPKTVLMEEEFTCTFSIFPKSRTKLRKIEVELYCQETAISRGTTDTYYHNNVHNDLRIPVEECEITPENPLEFKESFQLPPFTTPTIHTHNHRVEWFVRARLDVPWWPDTRKMAQIFVYPCMVTSEIY